MSLNLFIPQIWSARILTQLRNVLVYAQEGVINRDYQGEISNVGDTVRIHTLGDPVVFDYVKNTDMPNPETMDGTEETLQITQAKGFNLQVDDIDAVQQQPKVMDQAMKNAAYVLASIADRYVATVMVAGADPANSIGTDAAPITPTSTSGDSGAYEQLVDLSTSLNEANAPREGRWVIVPPWFEGRLLKDDRFVHANEVSLAIGDPLINGAIGRAAGFAVMVSNNVPTVAAPGGNANPNPRSKIVAGHGWGVTFADQIGKVEAFRPERRFADAVKGLHLYGADAIRPNVLAVLTATRASS